MKISLPLVPLLAAALAAGVAFPSTAVAAALASTTAAGASAMPDAPDAPDPAVLAQLEQATRDGRFGAAYKRGLRSTPPGDIRDRVLALDDDIVSGVFARIAARRFDLVEATAIAAFYASPDGRALTEAQLAEPSGPRPSVSPTQRAAIAAFFASPTGAKFNALLSDAAFRDELQLALAFIAGPGSPP